MSAKRYQKKPVEISAMLMDGSIESAKDAVAWIVHNGGEAMLREPVVLRQFDETGGDGRDLYPVQITTLEGPMIASPGDYVIRGLAGEFYPCRADIFAASYDAVGVRPDEMKPIPVSAAKRIAADFGYNQVVVFGRRVGQVPEPHGEHLTTYGANPEHCAIAARMGEVLSKFGQERWAMSEPKMPEAFVRCLERHGAESLPWKREPCEGEAWGATVRGAQLCIVDTWHKEGWKVSVIPAGESFNAFKHPVMVPYGETSEELTRKLAPYLLPDPRMANLPEEIGEAFENFINLHHAWGTEFTVKDVGIGQVFLQWNGPEGAASRASFSAAVIRAGVYRWSFAATEDRASGHLIDVYAHASCSEGPLRRSADFAEFVQRFKPVTTDG